MSREYTQTEKVIAEMLFTSTGSNFLDSGFAYGRAWQKTQANLWNYWLLPGHDLTRSWQLPGFSARAGELAAFARKRRQSQQPERETPLTFDQLVQLIQYVEGLPDRASVYAMWLDRRPAAWYEVYTRQNTSGEPATDNWELSFALDTYHWLVERLEYSPEMTAFVEAWEEANPDKVEDGYAHWTGELEPFIEWCKGYRDDQGLGGQIEAEETLGENTYNRDSALYDILQYQGYRFEFPGGETAYLRRDEDGDGDDGRRVPFPPHGEYIFLQIHRGADARGGYTAGRWFTGGEWSEYPLADHDHGTLWAQGGDSYYDTENAGYHWLSADYPQRGKNLEQYRLTNDAALWAADHNDELVLVTIDRQLLHPKTGKRLVAGS
jgi:hypothetical protein